MKYIPIRFNFLIILAPLCAVFTSCETESRGPWFATGMKIGEVTQTDAIVWARLTQNPERVGNDAPMPDVRYRDSQTGELIERKGRPNSEPVVSYPEGFDIENVQGAAPGSEGWVRLKYKAKDAMDWIEGDWVTVNPERAFTHQFLLSELSPGTKYEVFMEASPNGKKVSAAMEGRFATAPSAEVAAEVTFIVTTGTSYGDVDSDQGYKFYLSSMKLDPDFFVHTGDIVYYDRLGKTADMARWHWERMYSYPNNMMYHRQVASYFMKDDHDTWMNDCYPGMATKFMGEFTYEEGTQIFLDEVPMGDKTYRTFRWGKDLQIWLMEGRDFRSRNIAPDGPGKTIWGKEQMEWLKSTVKNSNATYKVLISPTPIVGPDRGNKNDNHANVGFTYEGDLIRQYLSEQHNMVAVCGDRHWQYISKDLETGLLEFSCGPGSNDHAGGWDQENKLPEHLYLNVVGGFLEGTIIQSGEAPALVFRHYNPDGELLHEFTVPVN